MIRARSLKVAALVVASAALPAALSATLSPKATTPAPVPVAGSSSAGALLFNYRGSDIMANWATGTTAISEWEPGSCSAPNGATVSVNIDGYLDLHSTGKNGSCALAASKAAYTEGVTEYSIDVPANGSKVSLWPAAWMAGDSWPTRGETDAYEGQAGTDYASYYYGASAAAVYGQTTGYAWSGGGYSTVNTGGVKAGPGPGWHVVDIVRTKAEVQVYYDGALYATFATKGGSVVSGDFPQHVLLDITNDTGANGYGTTPSHLYVDYVREWAAPSPPAGIKRRA